MKMHKITWLSVLLLGLGSFLTAAPGLVLARRGADASYVIMHAAQAPDSVILACQEFQQFICQMTGVTLPLVSDEAALPARAVIVGDTRYSRQLLGASYDLAGLLDDGFRLQVSGEHLLVLGGKRGAMYGLFELLERFGGCRWYASWSSVIPERNEFEVPKTLSEVQKPAFMMREPFWYDMFNTQMAYRNKCNGNRMNLTAKQGDKIRFGGGMFVHTFDRLVPSKEFFATHPEYFSEIRGKRFDGYGQLCLTNSDVLRILTERLLEAIRKDPTAWVYSVSQNDVRNFCECPKCNAKAEEFGGQAGLMVWFVNQVAEAVEKEFPQALIETLAYQYTRQAPQNVKPRKNVLIRLCTIECDFSKPLDVSTRPQNQQFVKDIKDWNALTDKLFIWDYVTNFGHYVGPFPNFASLQGNVKFFRDNNVIGLMEQGAYQGYHAEFAELRGWLLAKWLWNPELKQEELYDDFFAGYYGAAGRLVREYFDALQELVLSPEIDLRIWAPMTSAWLTDEFLDWSLRQWQQAEQAVANDPVRLYNVRKGAIPVYYALISRQPVVNSKWVWTPSGLTSAEVPEQLATWSRELLERFEEVGPGEEKARSIIIAESQDRHHSALNLWRSYYQGYPLQWLSHQDSKLRCAVSPAYGGRSGLLLDADGFNYLAAGSAGIDFNHAGQAMIEPSANVYQPFASPGQAHPAGSWLGLRYGHWRHEFRREREYLMTAAGLSVTNRVVRQQDGSQLPRCISTFPLHLGKDRAVCLKWDDRPWQSYAMAGDLANEIFNLPAKEWAGSKSLTVASPASGRAVQISVPKVDFERMVLSLEPGLECVRLVFVESPVNVARDKSSERQFVLRPTEASGVPKVTVEKETARKRVVYEDCFLPVGRPGNWGEYVDDPEAGDGAALKLFNTHYEWCVQFRPEMSQFKMDKKYQIRWRVKVIPKDKDGEAFWTGVYDRVKKLHRGQVQPKVADTTPEYRWYDSIIWTPNDDDYVWFGPGRFEKEGGQSAIEAVYIDKLEFVELVD